MESVGPFRGPMESMGLSFRGSATSADLSFRGPSTRVGPNDACPGLRWHPGRRLFRDGEGVACPIGHVTFSPSFLISAFALLCTFVRLLSFDLKRLRACCRAALCCCVSLSCVCTCLCFALSCLWRRLLFPVSYSFPTQLSSSVCSFTGDLV